MSRTIDQRVVEMRFDNKHFENNVSNTMSTLDKLKQKLNLSGASKGLSDIDSAAKKVNMSGLGNAVEAVSAKFSALQVMGVTALAKITSSAMDAGWKITKALTIDPIMSGFSEYETQINSVQTILANTESKGSTLQDVNRALDELNTYADKTIYNFTEMTRNIGTFTAAGVDLDTSVKSIQGIANLAAVSGSTSQQASSAMYQLSQALAAGKVSLMDWNSVVNAGMGGQVFQDALKRTSEVLGTGAEDAIKKFGSFRESLTQGEWLTTEVLTKTLEQFTMAAEEGSDAWKQYKKSLMDDGYTEAQAESILKMANTATDAATKVKTFSQLWDTLKESAQSGWTQTWEILIGDFEEAKNFLTQISNTIGGMIGNSAEARNAVLSEGLSSGWKQLLGAGIADEEGYKDSLKNVAKEHGVMIDDMIKAEKELDTSLSDNEAFQKVLKKGLTDGTISSDMMAQSVHNLADKMTNMTAEERAAAGYTAEHVEQIKKLSDGLKDGSISMDDFVKKITRASGRENIIQSLWNAFDGLMSVVKPIREAFGEIFKPLTGEHLYKFTETLVKFTEKLTLSGKAAEQIKATFKGVFSIVSLFGKAFGAVGKAIGQLLVSDGVASLVDLFLDITAAIGDFFTAINDKFNTGKLSDGLSVVVDIISNLLLLVTEGIRGIGDFFSPLFDGFNVDKLSEIFSNISDGAIRLLESASEGISGFGDILASAGKVIADVASKIWNAIKPVFTWISENVSIGDIFAGLAGGGVFVLAKKLADVFGKIKDVLDGMFGDGDNKGGGIKEKFGDILDSVSDSLQAFTSGIKVWSLVGIAAAIGILSASLNSIADLDVPDIAKSLFTIGAMLGMLSLTFGSMVKTLSKFDSKGIVKSSFALILVAAAVNVLADAMKEFAGMSLEEIGKGLLGVGGGLAELAIGLKIIGKTKISLATSIAMLALAQSCKVLGDAMQKFSGLSWDEIGRGLTGMGGALGELVIALSVLSKAGGFGSLLGSVGVLIAVQSLSKMADGLKKFADFSWEEIKRGLAAMGGALGELAIALGGLGKIAGFSSIFAAGSIVIVVQGLDDLADSLKKFGQLSWDEIGKGLAGMGGALGEVAGLTGILGKLAGFSSIFAAGSILIVVQGLGKLADALKKFGQMTWDEIGRGLTAMGGALTELMYITVATGKLAGFSGIIGSGAILLLIQGLDDLANAMKKFAGMSWDEIGRGLVGMGGALGEVAIISGVLGGLTGFAGLIGSGSILIAIQGLGDLADALKKFGEMSWDEIGRGLTAMGAALGEIALGGFLNTLSIIGSFSIAEVAEPLGVLADSVKKWNGVTVPENLGVQLALLADGVFAFTFGGSGASAISEIATPLGILADSVMKWSNVVVPETLGMQLTSLAEGVKAFTFGGMGASAIAEVAIPLGNLATSVSKWSSITVPENLGTQLTSLADGVKAFSWAFMGGWSIDSIIEPLSALPDAVKKWTGVSVPENLSTQLTSLADGVKAFSWAFMGGWSLDTVVGPLGNLASSVTKWSGVTIPETLGTQLSTLAEGVKAFTFGGMGAGTLSEIATPLGTLASSVTKWSSVIVPEGLGTQLSTLASGVKAFTFGGSGAATISEVASPLGTLATAVSKWTSVIVPEGLGEQLKTLASGVKAFTFGGLGAGAIAEVASPLGNLASSVTKWSNVVVPENLGAQLKTLAGGVKSFTFGGSGASTLAEVAAPLGTLANSVTKWIKITIPDDLGSKFKSLSSAVKSFTFGGSGASAIAEVAAPLGTLASSVSKWSKVKIPENLGTQLTTVATGIKAFSGVGNLSNTSKGMDSIASSAKKLAGVDYSSISSGVSILSSSLSKLSGLDTSGASAVEAVGKSISSAADSIKKSSGKFSSAGSDIMGALAKGMTSGQSKTTNAANTITNAISKTFKSKTSTFNNTGKELVNALAKGLSSGKSKVGTAALGSITSALSRIRGQYGNFYNAGSYLVSGFAAGISANSYKAAAKAAAMASAAYQAAKSALDINSPSKIFYSLGSGVVEGFVDAIVDNGNQASVASVGMAKTAISSFSDAISRIGDSIDSDMDLQPTIRPVLDLSNIKTGAGAINGLLGTGSSIGMMANVGAISAMMNRRNQNGVESEVVSAINKLRKDLGNVGNTTYNVNGITYDDGSNVSSAVQALIRAARVERRV